jgi:sRNA-binding carbon storage regulator CsrA
VRNHRRGPKPGPGLSRLVLRRKLGERIVIPQHRIILCVERLGDLQVGLSFTAPIETEIYREEVWQKRLAGSRSPG